jgi:hypothetical protein
MRSTHWCIPVPSATGVKWPQHWRRRGHLGRAAGLGDIGTFVNPSLRKPFLPIFVRMHPFVRRDLMSLGELDHVNRRSVAALAT